MEKVGCGVVSKLRRWVQRNPSHFDCETFEMSW